MYLLNGYFRSQAVTGQQRYATEIADRLPALLPALREVQPTARSATSRYRQWVELQTRLPCVARGRTLLSLTSRNPVAHPRQVVTIHDLFPVTNPEWYAKEYAALHTRLLRHNLRHAAGIAVVSEPVRDQVLDLLADRDVPVVTVPNAPSTAVRAEDDDIRWSSSSEPQVLAHRDVDGYFLTVGSVEPRKNLPRLLKAYATLPLELRRRYPLVMVGDVAASFRSVEGLSAAVRTEGVVTTGRVSDLELARLYRHATAFLTVSLAEGFGLPVVEAAATMRGALVVSDIPVYRWVVGEESAIYADPTSVESIADALARAVTSTPDVASLRRLAARFSWDSSARGFAGLARMVSAG